MQPQNDQTLYIRFNQVQVTTNICK